jgi:hypothetical protein
LLFIPQELDFQIDPGCGSDGAVGATAARDLTATSPSG